MKTITLTQGKVALVDEEDFERANQFNWYAAKAKSGLWYARRNITVGKGKQKTQRLHQFLMPDISQIDHKDGDGLNCQRKNLRPATSVQNQANQKKQTGRSSKFKGVNFHKVTGLWQANICKHQRQIYLGVFQTEEQAAQAYDRKAVELFGEFAKLNLTATGSCANILDRDKPATNENMITYKIVRTYHPSLNQESETIDTGLSLAEAQAHCSDPATREPGVYFDGYFEE